MLDLTSLAKAIEQLKKSYAYSHSSLAKEDAELFFQFRAATIQAFEYTYQLSVKMLQRQLEDMSEIPEDIEKQAYKEMIRTGAEKGLIDDPVTWFTFREKRNITSHTYDEEKAEAVYDIIESFIAKAESLYQKIYEKNS